MRMRNVWTEGFSGIHLYDIAQKTKSEKINIRHSFFDYFDAHVVELNIR